MSSDKNTAFLGTGWGFPVEFDGYGEDIKMVSGEDDIRESLKILLSTGLQERLMRKDFYCDMNRFLFEEMDDTLFSSIENTVKDALLYHEPRIKVDNVEVQESEQQQGLLLIKVEYSIIITNS